MNGRKNQIVAKIVPLQFIMVSLALCFMGVSGLQDGFRLKSYEKSHPSEYVIGTVISYSSSSSSSRKSSTYAPVYEYSYDGTTYQYTSPLGSSDSREKYPEGSITTLILFDGDPSTVREDGFFWELRFYYGGVLSLFAAIVFAVVGGLISFAISSLSADYESKSSFYKQGEPTLLYKIRTSNDQFFLLSGGLFTTIAVVFMATGFFLGDDALFGSSFFSLGLIAALVGGKFLHTFFSSLK